jgi:hypothetical protein
MLKRFIYEVVAESEEAAENRLREENKGKHYLLTTEPFTEPLRKIKEAQVLARVGYDKILETGEEVLVAYKEGYLDALDDLIKELGI